MHSKRLNSEQLQTIGFRHFAAFMERKIEQMFVEAIGPVMTNLKGLKDNLHKREVSLQAELGETDQTRILSTTRDCGASFATALTHVMEGRGVGQC